MSEVPPASRYLIAAVVSCDECSATGRLPAPRSRPPTTATIRCHYCVDGIRTVITDTEVEPDDATSGDRTVRVWLEVER